MTITERLLELAYVVINDGTISIQQSTEDVRVRDLSRAIQKYVDDKKPFRLFIARKSDRSWQTLTMRDAQRLRRKEPVPFVKELLVDENEMDPRCQLIDFQFPTRDSINRSDVHILVLKPEYVSVAPEWKPETTWEFSLLTLAHYFLWDAVVLLRSYRVFTILTTPGLATDREELRGKFHW
ncbi:hypothetical protein GN244_ATG11665 [Phytophthora infestans]|uniref:Crinkler (CRN) family protein n=1 Tax=Phytophthora infestans TaxID=4787 RepID=A0A833T1J5_PHYIN|nr:hypothetical protein GN244_ATG11665 [Phytophthora infestans]